MIVFDLDQTLRDITGSAPYAPCGDHQFDNKNWTNWQNWVNANGTVIENIAELYTQFVVNQSDTVAIVTSSQFGTVEWLERHGLPLPDLIVERKADDHRHPHELKKHWIHNLAPTITLWIDDDVKMLDYVESLGIPVVRVNR